MSFTSLKQIELKVIKKLNTTKDKLRTAFIQNQNEVFFNAWLLTIYINIIKPQITFVVKGIVIRNRETYTNAVVRTLCEFSCFVNLSARPLETVSKYPN